MEKLTYTTTGREEQLRKRCKHLYSIFLDVRVFVFLKVGVAGRVFSYQAPTNSLFSFGRQTVFAYKTILKLSF